jgi:hypothetical protein
MPLAGQTSSRVSRISVLALLGLPLTVPGAVLAERAGPTGWQLVPTRTSPLVRITSDPVLGLYPGVSKDLTLTLHNSVARRSVIVSRIHVRDVATTKTGCAASPLDLVIRQHQGGSVRIPPGRTRAVTAILAMPNTVSDACQQARFKLRYTAHAAVVRGG